MNKVRNVLLTSIIILIAATAFFTMGLLTGGFGGYRVATVRIEAQGRAQAKAEYYRGVYDICLQQTRQKELCLKTVRKITEAGWYDKPSSGWEWPIATDGTIATVTPK